MTLMGLCFSVVRDWRLDIISSGDKARRAWFSDVVDIHDIRPEDAPAVTDAQRARVDLLAPHDNGQGAGGTRRYRSARGSGANGTCRHCSATGTGRDRSASATGNCRFR